MKTVLRQEWRASKKRIFIASAVLAAIMGFCILINVLAYYTNAKHISGFGTLLYILCLQVATWGVVVFSLSKGSGNLHTILFKDTNYLMLTVPKRSWILMGGKILMNLFEFIIYALPSAIYLSFLGPTGEFIFFHTNQIFSTNFESNGTAYWYNVQMLYKTVFDNLGQSLQIILSIIIIFVVIQVFFNMAFAIFASFIKSKKKHSILMAIIIFFMFYIPIKVSSSLYDAFFAHTESPQILAIVAIMLAFAVVYFVLTSWLIENKIEV
jgi:hypothetical protein